MKNNQPAQFFDYLATDYLISSDLSYDDEIENDSDILERGKYNYGRTVVNESEKVDSNNMPIAAIAIKNINKQQLDNDDDIIQHPWKVRFLKSGQLFVKQDIAVDIFLVGSGGNGFWSGSESIGGGGGGGGHTATYSNIQLYKDTIYDIQIGSPPSMQQDVAPQSGDGQKTFISGRDILYSVNGGSTSNLKNGDGYRGGDGGSGGGGGRKNKKLGQNGYAGGNPIKSQIYGDGNNPTYSGIGQLKQDSTNTTYEFNEIYVRSENDEIVTYSIYYAGGGGGSGGWDTRGYGGPGNGGAGGGGRGFGYSNDDFRWATGGEQNTGGGGGGGIRRPGNSNYKAGKGGTGIVIIRPHTTPSQQLILNNNQYAFIQAASDPSGVWSSTETSYRELENTTLYLRACEYPAWNSSYAIPSGAAALTATNVGAGKGRLEYDSDNNYFVYTYGPPEASDVQVKPNYYIRPNNQVYMVAYASDGVNFVEDTIGQYGKIAYSKIDTADNISTTTSALIHDSCEPNTDIILNAIPESSNGAIFQSWSFESTNFNDTSTLNEYNPQQQLTLNNNAAVRLYANFVPKKYGIKNTILIKHGEGKPEGVDNSGNYIGYLAENELGFDMLNNQLYIGKQQNLENSTYVKPFRVGGAPVVIWENTNASPASSSVAALGAFTITASDSYSKTSVWNFNESLELGIIYRAATTTNEYLPITPCAVGLTTRCVFPAHGINSNHLKRDVTIDSNSISFTSGYYPITSVSNNYVIPYKIIQY